MDDSSQQNESVPRNQSPQEEESVSNAGDRIIEDEDMGSLPKSPDINLDPKQKKKIQTLLAHRNRSHHGSLNLHNSALTGVEVCEGSRRVPLKGTIDWLVRA